MRHPGVPPDRSVLADRSGVPHARPVGQLARHRAAGVAVGVLARLLRLAAARPRHPAGLRSRVRGDHRPDHPARRRTAGRRHIGHGWNRVRYETSDVNVRAILTVGAGLAADRRCRRGASSGCLVLFYFSGRESAQTGPREFPLAVTHEQRLPPEPRLQTNPREDLADLRRAEDGCSTATGGWTRTPASCGSRSTMRCG